MRFLILVLAGLAVAGCSVSGGGGVYRYPPDRHRGMEMVPNVAYGSVYEQSLATGDLYEMSRAFEQAMAAPVGTSTNWQDRRSMSGGTVTAGESYLTNVDFARGRRLIAPVGLYTNDPLEPDQGDYEVKSNTNVRLGPNTNAPIANTLTEGTVLESAGRVRGGEWLLMARGGVVIGYMYGPLLERRDGGDLLLAGGTARTPTYCRDYSQSLRLRGGSYDEWTGTACRDASGRWVVETGRGRGPVG